ncbi:MAG: class I SAM-dependent methyltransferase [Cyanobacteria bacterium P01_H01_bin.121]
MQTNDNWGEQALTVANRFNKEYEGKAFELPAEIEAMPLYQAWRSGKLQMQVASTFWELAQPKKKQHCLDIGCGLSFLVYPWREWEAFFYGHDVSSVARDALMSRGPQLNSKLFKGVKLKAAHHLDIYEPEQFDLAIATGVSCYYSLDYWEQVLLQVKRILKPGSYFVFDTVRADTDLAENWAILETYLGAEVYLEDPADWLAIIKKVGGKLSGQQENELFQLYRVRF